MSLQILYNFIYFNIFFILIANKQTQIKKVSLLTSTIIFFLSIYLLIIFDRSFTNFQYITNLKIIKISTKFFYNFKFIYGIDGISLFFILLTTFIIPLCIIISWNICFNSLFLYQFYYICIFLLEFFLLKSFVSLDVLSYYFFFESTLLPTFFLIGIWGSTDNKIRAIFFFLMYTVFGSVFLLICILLVFLEKGTTHISYIITHL
jgi:NADH:ubiquinone oxidoreductase subunit 4 (subunit M)